MKNRMTRCLLALLLVLVLAVSFAACGKDPAGTTEPETTEPQVTTPEATTPEETEPEVTVPEETDPEVTLPEETLPDETLPDETLPDETLPGETEPEETKPADTTKPAETTGPHKHEYQVVEKYPTCDADGTITYICACGDSYEEPGEPAVGHAWIADGEPTKSATPCLTPDSQAYKCVSCGATEVRQSALVPHDFSVSALLVSAEEDPFEKGYELLACSMCDLYMTKVIANHVSGHYFAENGDCACGTVAVAEDHTLGVNNLEDKKDISVPSFAEADGKLLASGFNGQKAVQASQMASYLELLTGVYDGKSVSDTFYSFDIFYNKPVPKGYGSSASDKHFFTWRTGTSASKNYEVTLFLYDDGEGKLLASNGKDVIVTLEKDESYTFTVSMKPTTRELSFTVKGKFMGEDGQTLTEKEIVLIAPKAMNGETLVNLFFARDLFYYEDSATFALYMDNFTLSYEERKLDDSAMNKIEDCEHAFTSERLVDAAHPSEEMWFRETCENCGRFFERQDCELLGGHVAGVFVRVETAADCVNGGVDIYSCASCGADVEVATEALGHAWDDGVVTKQNDCTQEGVLTYTCLECGETEEEVLKAEHVYAIFADIVSKKDDLRGVGYELYQCIGCKEMTKVAATHESGHAFDANNVCACGAELVATVTNTNKHTFDSSASDSIATSNVDQIVVESVNGESKWLFSGIKEGKQPAIWATNANHKTFKDALGGSFNAYAALLSFELSYTGSVATKSAAMFSWRSNLTPEDPNTFKYEFEVNAATEDGKFVVEGNTLEPDVNYTVNAYGYLATNTYAVVLTGGDYENQVLKSGTLTNPAGYAYTLVFRSNDFVSDAAKGKIYVDNISLNYVTVAVSEADMATADCAHDFLVATEGETLKFTCDLCGCYYTEPACELNGGHIWGETEITGAENCSGETTETKTCLICNTIDSKVYPSGHVYNVFVSRTAKADDPRGVGYELWSCRGCNEMVKIEGNHDNGHLLVDDVCACGAKYGDIPTLAGSHNFEQADSTGFLLINCNNGADLIRESVGGDMKWVFSNLNKQPAINAESGRNVQFAQALKNEDVTKLVLSFELSYTGKLKFTGAAATEQFINYRTSKHQQESVSVMTTSADGKLTIDGNVLDAEKPYIFTMTVDFATNTIVNTLSDGTNTIVLSTKTSKNDLQGDFASIFFRPNKFMSDVNNGKVYMDDLKVEFISEGFTEADAATSVCEHSFTAKNSADERYPAEDGYMKYSCEDCNRFYFELGCEKLGHAWGEPVVTEAESCLENTIEDYTCLVCGATKQEKLPAGEHVYKTLTEICPKINDPAGKGYELLACVCGAMKKVEANHSSGHCFGEDLTCACGATAKPGVDTVASHDFTAVKSGSVILTNQDKIVIEDGKLVLSKTNAQPAAGKGDNYAVTSLMQSDAAMVAVSFELSYTSLGSFSLSSENLFSFRNTKADGTSQQNEIEVPGAATNGVLSLGGKTLTSGVTYVVEILIDPVSGAWTVTLTGGDYDKTALKSGTLVRPLSTYNTFVLRGNKYQVDAANGAIYVDNLRFGYASYDIVSTPTYSSLCDHKFTSVAVEGETNLYTHTCSVCGRSYEGTKILTAQTVEVTKIDFADSSSVGATELTVTNLTEDDLADGMWNHSIRGAQSFIRPSNSSVDGVDTTRNQTLAQLLKGKDADGNRVAYVDLAFKFKYTGSLATLGTGKVLLNMMEDSSGGTPVQFYLDGNTEGKAVIYENTSKSTTAVLEADTLYTITLRFVLADNAVQVIVTDSSDNEVYTTKVSCTRALSPMRQIGIGRAAYASETFSILFDEIALSYVAFK